MVFVRGEFIYGDTQILPALWEEVCCDFAQQILLFKGMYGNKHPEEAGGKDILKKVQMVRYIFSRHS